MLSMSQYSTIVHSQVFVHKTGHRYRKWVKMITIGELLSSTSVSGHTKLMISFLSEDHLCSHSKNIVVPFFHLLFCGQVFGLRRTNCFMGSSHEWYLSSLWEHVLCVTRSFCQAHNQDPCERRSFYAW